MNPTAKFELVESHWGDMERFILRSPQGVELEVLAGMGGSVIGWRVPQNGETLHLMEGYASAEEVQERFNSSHCGARLTPFPNRVRSGKWNWCGKSYQLPCNFPWEQGHAIHGLLFDQKWTKTSWFSAEKFGKLSLECHYDGSQAGFPFAFKAISTYSLSNAGFQVETTVSNTGEKPMPLGEGWHPYFGFGDSINKLQLRLPSALKRIEVDDRSIPTGKSTADTTWDKLRAIDDAEINTCWEIPPNESDLAEVELHCPQRGTIRYWQNMGAKGYKYLQLYTPGHRNYLAIEPMTCPADVFNNHRDLVVLKPGEEGGRSSWIWGAEFAAN